MEVCAMCGREHDTPSSWVCNVAECGHEFAFHYCSQVCYEVVHVRKTSNYALNVLLASLDRGTQLRNTTVLSHWKAIARHFYPLSVLRSPTYAIEIWSSADKTKQVIDVRTRRMSQANRKLFAMLYTP
jgi:hypothetical protein